MVVGTDPLQQTLRLRSVMGLPRHQAAGQQAALGINQDMQLGAEAASAASLGLRVLTALLTPGAGRDRVRTDMGDVQVHPARLRPFLGAGGRQTFPDPGQAPAPVAAKEAVPMSEAARQVPPWDPRGQEVVDPVQEAAEIPVRPHAHGRVPLQQTEQDLEFVGAQCVTGHGRGAVKGSATSAG